MKKIPNPFSWYPSDFWYWPDEDEKLLQVIHQVHDLDQVLPLIPNKGVCVQAGGACGVWPIYLSLSFDNVFSFEAEYENYMCAMINIKMSRSRDIHFMHCATGDSERWALVESDEDSEPANSGASFIYDGNRYYPDPPNIKIMAIDSMEYSFVDFICLDAEGFEYKTLIGAAKTIGRFNPVIMIEEKPLPHLKPGEHLKARQYLESIGYKEVLKVNRDVVFKRD